MRFGGPLSDWGESPEQYIAAAKAAGYRAVYFPDGPFCDDARAGEMGKAAAEADIVIAEVGAWSNLISADAEEQKEAKAKCIAALATAEAAGARCAVNIAGSRGKKWDGPDPRDLSDDTFEMIVETVREIIDAVQPKRTYYTLETMPWMYPDSADSYIRLLDAIDRPAAAAHFDPVNIINSPSRYFDTGAVLREFVEKLGPRIRSCHAKDITLGDQLTVHLSECAPGTGGLDYRTYLAELGRLAPDTPLMMEHMKAEEYPAAAEYIRSIATEIGTSL